MSPLKDLVVSGEKERRLLAEAERRWRKSAGCEYRVVKVADGRALYAVPVRTDTAQFDLRVLASSPSEADELSGLWMDRRGDEWYRGQGPARRVSAWQRAGGREP